MTSLSQGVRAGQFSDTEGKRLGSLVKVAEKADFASGEGRVVDANGRPIALFNCNGEFYALDNVCVHRGGPLGEGIVDCNNRTVQCPWHGWTYDLTSGVSPINPLARVEKFDVTVEGEDIKVLLD
jgi:nitrite reductase/ring-hydroxylating ferredoxin subunit